MTIVRVLRSIAVIVDPSCHTSLGMGCEMAADEVERKTQAEINRTNIDAL
jgi:hypothetical protein